MGDGVLALVRFSGDVGIKARATRRQFERRLLNNLRDAVASQGASPRLHPSHDRVFVELESPDQADALTRVFGVQSVSVVEGRCPTRLPEIVSAGAARFRERVRGRRFAVRARRVGDRSRIPVRAGEVKRALGEALLGFSAGVDLDDPEVTVQLEILEDATCFLSERIPGHGGVPLGADARAVALVSGGFDSAVAAWQILRRGVRLDYAFCNLGGAAHLQGVLRVVKVLADRWSYGTHPQLHIIDFEELSAALQARTETRYWQVLLKRLMLRAAEGVARARRATAVVTGEAVAQVSSQTLQNLAVISQAATGLILRPLVGSNKEEIIALAERIGTFELSKVVGEYCAMVPSRPATGASPRAIRAEEEKLDAGLLERAVAARTVIDLRGFDVEKLDLPEIEVRTVPEGATVIDLRSKAEFATWHYPGALHLEFAQALRTFPRVDRSQTYVLYCEFGLKSAHLAELMRREGLDAFHVKGGTRSLRRREAQSGGTG